MLRKRCTFPLPSLYVCELRLTDSQLRERTKANQLAKAGCLPRGMSDFQTIIDFGHPAASLSFRYVNDTAMGGGSGFHHCATA